MKNKTKDIAVCAVFCTCVVGFFVFCLLHSPVQFSASERRKLQQLPALSVQTVQNGEFFTKLSDYCVDQFPLREPLRGLKAFVHNEVYTQKDNNGVYIADGSASKLEYPLKESSVLACAQKLNSLYDSFLAGTDVKAYYAVIPDKNYFLAAQNGYPAMDYDRLLSLYTQNVQQMQYISLPDCLQIEDYYTTDTHWKQENLQKVVNRLSGAMGFSVMTQYVKTELSPFYGVYCGQSALNLPPDTLTYLSNDTLNDCIVTNLEKGTTEHIYTPESFANVDPYDVFLSGPCSVLTIENPNANTQKELVIFRDSYASSLAPLLAGGYSRITLIDLRYISTDYLSQFVTFTDQDVLFLYNTILINNSAMLK